MDAPGIDIHRALHLNSDPGTSIRPTWPRIGGLAACIRSRQGTGRLATSSRPGSRQVSLWANGA